MVSWSDETSEDSVLNISSSCDGIIKLPATMHDPNINGTDTDVNVLCEHGEPAERFVAFEGMHTGRRFLGCAKKEGLNCGVVQWIDFEWPDSMEKALAKLWDKYEEIKSARTNDNLESSFAIHNLTEEKKKLQENYDNLYADVNALLDAQQQRVGNLKAELSKKEEEKKKLQENYDSLYADVNSLLDAQQQRGVELKNQKEQKEYVDVKIVELETVVGNLKAELSKIEEEKKKMLQNYETLKNLAGAQANVIRNLKFNHLKEKERLTEERLKL
nr:kinesin-like protein KIP1 [Aegilops tauschii subsp. strangulata]